MKLNLKKLAAVLAFSASLLLPAAAFAVDEPGDPPIENNFDGKAYFVWECNGGKPCYHLFENLMKPEDGINYIKNTEITDQSGNGVNYVFKQKNADWVLPEEFNNVHSDNYEDYIGDEDKQTHGVTIQAIAFGGGNNSIATNEDWYFQVIIYRDGYKAITVGDSQDDYTYFPERWMFNYNYFIDISDTSATDPAVVTTYLKEPTIKLKTAGIVSVTPLNVNSGAVTVAPSLNGFDLTFNSSYYDHVVFELKASDGKTYYLMVARTALDVHDNFGPEVTDKDAAVVARVMYPSGSADGSTYKVIATVVDGDGKKTIHTLNSEEAIDRYWDEHEGKWIENNLGKSFDCGKALKCSQYSVKLGKKMGNYGVYLNVIKNGSSASVYSGTFSGSNKGALYYLADPNSKNFRKVIYE